MPEIIPLSENAIHKLKNGGVFVPSPLALNSELKPDEKYQRLGKTGRSQRC